MKYVIRSLAIFNIVVVFTAIPQILQFYLSGYEFVRGENLGQLVRGIFYYGWSLGILLVIVYVIIQFYLLYGDT